MVDNCEKLISLELQSDTKKLNCLCQQILDKAKQYHFSEDDIFAIHLALEEVFINAIKHGNQNDPNKKVKVQYMLDDSKLDITVEDQGRGFKHNCVPDPRCNDNILKLGGRGVLLMREYMDIVEFNDAGNQVHMIKYRAENN